MSNENKIENNSIEIKTNILINNVVNFILNPDKNNHNYRVTTIDKMFDNYTFTKRYIIFIIINDIFSKNKMSENDFNIIKKIINNCSKYTDYTDELYNSTLDHILYKIFLKKNLDQNRMNILNYILNTYKEFNSSITNNFSNKIIGHKFNGKDLTINAIKSHIIEFNSGKISAAKQEEIIEEKRKEEENKRIRLNMEKGRRKIQELLQLAEEETSKLTQTFALSRTGNSASSTQKSANSLQNEHNFNTLSREINLERELGNNNQINQLTALPTTHPIIPGVNNFINLEKGLGKNNNNQINQLTALPTTHPIIPGVNNFINLEKRLGKNNNNQINQHASQSITPVVNNFTNLEKRLGKNNKKQNNFINLERGLGSNNAQPVISIVPSSVNNFINLEKGLGKNNNNQINQRTAQPIIPGINNFTNLEKGFGKNNKKQNNFINLERRLGNNNAQPVVSLVPPSINLFSNPNILKQSQNNSIVTTPIVNPFNNLNILKQAGINSPNVKRIPFNGIQNNNKKSNKPPNKPTSSTPNNGSKSNNATLTLQSKDPIIPNTGAASNATKLSTLSNTQIINSKLRGNNTLKNAINSQKKATKLQEQATQLQEQASAEQKKTAVLFNRL